MNQKNFEYLRDQIKFSGFGTGLSSVLEENIKAGKDNFVINHQAKYGADIVNSTLNFRKSAETDRYFFNSFESTLKKADNAQTYTQRFAVLREGNITRKEAYNLLDGRSVHKELVSKEGRLYNSWLALDFKQHETNGNYKMQRYNNRYGFDLYQSLSQLPIKENLSEPTKRELIESLKKGNRSPATLQSEAGEQKIFIEANPKFKTLIVFDQNQQRLRQEQDQSQQHTHSHSHTQQNHPEDHSENSMSRKRGKNI
ncbi:MAG TPA: hypothetical protein VGN64_04055 [Dyadobacter sp.]|nr:hypothetical protein [Dyadobacter sp.]